MAKAITTRAAEALAAMRELKDKGASWVELHNACFGIDGIATKLFPRDADRAAFTKTPEFDQIMAMLDASVNEAKAGRLATANGNIIVRLPRAIHAALLAEAEAEGVSLNQLCVSKLCVQLRAVTR